MARGNFLRSLSMGHATLQITCANILDVSPCQMCLVWLSFSLEPKCHGWLAAILVDMSDMIPVCFIYFMLPWPDRAILLVLFSIIGKLRSQALSFYFILILFNFLLVVYLLWLWPMVSWLKLIMKGKLKIKNHSADYSTEIYNHGGTRENSYGGT